MSILLNQGLLLRQLRELERQDEAERAATAEETNGDENEMPERTQLSTGEAIVRYEYFLEHQRYYDDLKHVDMKFVDFGTLGTSTPLVVEQDKSLGKGGYCWDAGFILGEHIINNFEGREETITPSNMIELGCGTGLCGLMLAKALNVHVTLTDLPELMPLLRRNVARNFIDEKSGESVVEAAIKEYIGADNGIDDVRGSASASVLCWGDKEDEARHGTFDIILGADVVASVYDPIALSETICHLSHCSTKVYICCKGRLNTIHREFEDAMRDRFETIQILKPAGSHNRNPDVYIIVAETKKM
jgi:predicted nicotinamide N-methyase